MPRRGAAFEKAVFEFYRSIDPNADITFDHRVPDRDSGTSRQVDVWVKYTVLGHIALTVLISCKDHQRPLDIGEVETFLAEKESTGASVGVLYSRAGFTQPALAKARKRSVACCRLFDDSPPELPAELIVDAYVAYPTYRVRTEFLGRGKAPMLLWQEVLSQRPFGRQHQVSLAEGIAQMCMALLGQSMMARTGGRGGENGADRLVRHDIRESAECPPMRLHVALIWDWYAGKLNAHRLSGSFDSTQNKLFGTASVGPIPANATPRQTEWERCDGPSRSNERIRATFSPLACPIAATVQNVLGPHQVFGSNLWTFGPPSTEELDWALRAGHPGAGAGLDSILMSVDLRTKPRASA